MTEITAAMVKDLRERSGAGMMDCKKALAETKGNMEEAIDYLRKKGIIKAGSKSGRVAAEGLIGATITSHVGALVEVNSETDFVSRNDQFQDLVRKVTSIAPAAEGDIEKLKAAKYPGTSKSVDEAVKEAVATIGENINARRTAVLKVKDGVVADYVHNKVSDGLGKIGALVALESTGDKPKLAELGRQIAMHVAAATTLVALDIDSVPKDLLEREKAILAEKNQGKPAAVLDKIFQSSLKSYAKENCLIEQAFIYDTTKSVGQAVKEAEGRVGAPIKLAAYVRYKLGDGIDKVKEDFAAEVAKTLKG